MKSGLKGLTRRRLKVARARIARTLVAVLVGSLFVPVTSLVLPGVLGSSFLPAAQAAVVTAPCTTGSYTLTITGTVVTSTTNNSCVGHLDLTVFPITEIRNGDAFRNANITGVYFPKTLISVSGYASFYGISASSLSFPCSLASIGGQVFQFDSSLLKSVQLCADGGTPSQNFNMGYYAFGNNPGLARFSFGATAASSIKVTTWNDSGNPTWGSAPSTLWFQYCGTDQGMINHLVPPYVPTGVKVQCAQPASTSYAPQPPTGVSGTPAATSSVVSWSAPVSNGGSAITSYTVTSLPGRFTCTTTTTSCTVSGLTNGTPYKFVVVATNANGNSSPSIATDDVTPFTPYYVYCKNSMGGNETITVSDVVSSYSLSGCYGTVTLGAGITRLSEGSFLTSAQLTNIKSSPTYPADFNTNVTGIIFPAGFTTLDSHSLAGMGALSSLAFPNSLTSIPAAVFQRSNIKTLDFSAFQGSYGSFSISPSAFPFAERPQWWRDCSGSGSIPTSGYLFSYLATRTGTAYCNPTSIATLSALTPSSGNLQPAFVGSTLTYNLSVPSSTININFTTTLSDSRSAVSVNKIPQKDASNQSFTGNTLNSITVGAGTTVVSISVTAQDGVTQSNYTLNVTKSAFDVPGAPTGVGRTVGNASSIVSWTAPGSNGGSAITGYTVTSSPGGFTCTTLTTSCKVSGLTNGTPYTFTVGATNVAGNSVASTPSASVTPVSDDANLSALVLSTGALTPPFDSATVSYVASVGNAVPTITLTPTRNQSNATITVNGTPVTSGTASGPISLSVGPNIITVVVTAQNGTTKTYTVTVTRSSNDATLSALTLSSGTLNGSFVSTTETYTAAVGNAVSTITITPTRTQANATITVNGTSVTSGSASDPIALDVGSNVITVVVTAQDGVATKTYTVTVTRNSNDATLSALALSSGTLSPTFDSATSNYTATVLNSDSTLTVTPTRNQANATITVNGSSVMSGSASAPISLNIGLNTITVVVTAQDESTKTYTVTVTRPSNIATLSSASVIKGQIPSLGASSATLGGGTDGLLTLTTAQAIGAAATTFALSDTSAAISKIVKFAAGSLTSTFDSDSAFTNSSTEPLTTGDFFIIKVTAQDGTVNYTRINVTVNSNVATLSSASVIKGQVPTLGTSSATITGATPGALTLTTAQATGTAATTFALSDTSAAISKIVKFAAGSQATTFDSDGAFTNGSTAQITTGDFFVIKVTAADGTINYTRVDLTVNSNAATFTTFNLSQLAPSVAGTVDNTLYTVRLIVPVGTGVTNLVPEFTLSPGASVKVGGTPQISGQSANNFTSPVTYVVTSQDSGTVRSYTVTVTLASNPTAPQNVLANGQQGAVGLSWSAPASDGGRAITGYVIQRSLDQSSWTSIETTSASATSFNVAGLANGTTYYFRIYATNTSGSDIYNFSAVRSATTFYYVSCSISGSFYLSAQVIPMRAGQNCKGVATIPQGITGVALASFAKGDGGSPTDSNRDLTGLIFPASGFVNIDQGGFRNLGLTSVTIPASVTMVGLTAFQNNPLTSVFVTGTSGGASTVLSQGAFSNQGFGLTTAIALTLGSGKIEISYNFGINTTFSTVVFGGGLRSIDQGAFRFNGVAPGWIPFFPPTITTIGLEAFRNSPNLTTIRFGSETTTAITSINEWAFDKTLKSVQYCGPLGGANPLSRYLRDHQVNATIWCDFVAPNAPTISTTSKTTQRVTIGWTRGANRNEPPTDTFTIQYRSGGGAWITVPYETTTPLSSIINNLTNGTTYTFRVAANNIAGSSAFSNEVEVTPLALALTPILDTVTATADGFTFNVTNYSALFDWTGAVTAGSGTLTLGTPSGSLLPVTVSAMGPGATSSVQITTTRTNYETGTTSAAGTSLYALLTPTFGTPSITTNGYTVPITNFNSNYTWAVLTSSGSASIVNDQLVVTGASFATLVIETVTATRPGYAQGSAVFSATTLAGLTATYGGNGSNGGSVPSDTATYQSNSTFTLLGNSGNLSKSGYTFAGWKDNFATPYQPGAIYTLANANVSFDAQWTANPYRTFYNPTEATAGSIPTDSNIYTIEGIANVRGNSNNLQRTGYTFSGWTDNANRTGRIFVSGDTYTVPASDINFYAAWTPNTYAITFDLNGASGSPSKLSDSYTVDSTPAQVATVGNMTKSGYNFGGWSTQAVGAAISETFTVAADTTLFAQWNIASFTLTYDLDGGTGVVDTPTAVNYLQQFNLAPATGFTKTIGSDAYAFVAWSANSATYNPGQSYFMPASNLTFTATWTRIYNVTYSFSGGSVANAIADQQKIALDTITVTSEVPTRAGYDFTGWVDQSGESATAASTYVVRDGHYLLYAQWSATPYTVTYNAAGGTPAPTESAKTIGQSFAVGAAPTREFYNFNGWFDGTNTYFDGAPYVTGSSNIVFTAQWQAKVFIVTYDLNGGSGSAGGNHSYTYATPAYTLPTAGLSLTDYNFGGWARTVGGPSVGATFTTSVDVTLYAIWNIAIYRLNFDGQSGISESATAKVTIGQSLALPNATRANHTMQGWSNQQSGGSLTASGASFTPTSDLTLYAQWALQIFTVTYNGNGGTSVTQSAQFTYSSTTPLVLPSATRLHYALNGWYSAATGGYLIGAAGANFSPASSLTIYAQWTQDSLVGLGDATKIAEVVVDNVSGNTFTAGSGGSTAAVSYQAGALPNGTVITAFVQNTTNRASSMIDPNYSYVLSIVVAWVAPNGTVPDTADGKPIVVTITNSSITKGSRIYKLVGSTTRVLGTATEDGRVEALLTQDPLVTVAITEPESPTALMAVAIDEVSSLVSWQAPEVNGGSPITEYVASSNAGQSCTTVTTSCTVSGLTPSTSYTFTVIARNSIGSSTPGAPSLAMTTPASPAPAAPSNPAPIVMPVIVAPDTETAITPTPEVPLTPTPNPNPTPNPEVNPQPGQDPNQNGKSDQDKAAENAQKLALEDAAKAAAEIVPAITVYSITNELTLSDYNLAYLRAYLTTLKPRAMVSCIGYTYTAITTLARATALATKQANALCAIIKSERPTLTTTIEIRSAESAPPAAAGSQWVAVSYRVDSYEPITPTKRYQTIQNGMNFLAYMPSFTAALDLKKIEITQCSTNKNYGLSAQYGTAKKSITITEFNVTKSCSLMNPIPKNAKRTIVVKNGTSKRPGARISLVTVGLSPLEIKKLAAGLVRVPLQ